MDRGNLSALSVAGLGVGRDNADKVEMFFLFSVAVLGFCVVLECWNPSTGALMKVFSPMEGC